MLIPPPGFQPLQPFYAPYALSPSALTYIPVQPYPRLADQLYLAGKPAKSPEPPKTFWEKIQDVLLTPFRWLKSLWQGNELKPGTPAPDFILNDHAGQPVQLHQALQKGPVVLFFYPKNNTAFCTKQVQAFRDAFPNFQGATIFGISSDSEKSHQQFYAEQKLPFALLSDPGGKVRKQYGAQRLWGLIPNRSTFVIDGPSGYIRTVYSSQANIGTHIEKALEGLKQKP